MTAKEVRDELARHETHHCDLVIRAPSGIWLSPLQAADVLHVDNAALHTALHSWSNPTMPECLQAHTDYQAQHGLCAQAHHSYMKTTKL